MATAAPGSFGARGRFCPYEVLGLSKSCSAADIKKAYKAKVFDLHPDRAMAANLQGNTAATNSSSSSSSNANDPNREEFLRVVRAYEILGDPQSRASHDRQSASGGGGINGDDASWASSGSSSGGSSSGGGTYYNQRFNEYARYRRRPSAYTDGGRPETTYADGTYYEGYYEAVQANRGPLYMPNWAMGLIVFVVAFSIGSLGMVIRSDRAKRLLSEEARGDELVHRLIRYEDDPSLVQKRLGAQFDAVVARMDRLDERLPPVAAPDASAAAPSSLPVPEQALQPQQQPPSPPA
ncbi:hypothetical protein BC831DRAFT_492698 [Entophlyctis helioformis]|nr:hypothetical protein BC831DRAFT_492698 [Entophlyctis helioformis]